MNIKKTTKKKESNYVFPDEKLAEFCIEVCGGGYTTKQTAEAMQMNSNLRELGKHKNKEGYFEVQK